jgi:hypothetical protein
MLRLCSGILRLCSGMLRLCLPAAQVKAAVAHVRRLKQKQRKGKLILSLWELSVLSSAISKVSENYTDDGKWNRTKDIFI